MTPLFKFHNLSKFPWLGHAVSDKSFGNISLYVGDSKETVLANRKKFFKEAGNLKEENVVEMQQIHGNHVKVVGEKEKGQLILETDAIITNTPDVALIVKAADCVPILLADPTNRAIGVVHAGWRGTAQEIVKLAVNHMEDHFGTSPSDLIVGIGPSIGPCCYEVDTPVIDAFSNFSYKDKIFSKVDDNHAHLDLWNANKFQLMEAGVKEKIIEVAKICTYDNSDKFFSERHDKQTGRFGSVVWLRPESVEGIKE